MLAISCRICFRELFIAFCPHRTISTELTTALKPFYFAVHPDLFGQHPMQRSVNENSLKQLGSLIELLERQHFLQESESRVLRFYIRDANAEMRDTFKLIELKLDKCTKDPKTVVQRLLELCNLPTDFVRNIKDMPIKSRNTSLKKDYKSGVDFNYGSDFSTFEESFQQAKEAAKKSLNSWLEENADLARARASALVDLREEVEKLQELMVTRLQLSDARYDCGWNYEHYRGCLKTLERMANLHEKDMQILKGRVVVFASFTGISLEGHVMLFTGDVLNNWIDFIRNIPKHDAFLTKIPLHENTLSQVLRNIKIGRRKFMPKQQAVEYAGHLNKVTTTLGDYLSFNKYPTSWPPLLSDYEIVIESEAGPLMVNPTGQLIAPATCPGSILVDFITTNLELAKERTKTYNEEKHVERELVEQCKEKLCLKSLTKDDSVTPQKMIKTLRSLLDTNQSELFHDINLNVTNYYSVLTDGIVCIPWDFMDR